MRRLQKTALHAFIGWINPLNWSDAYWVNPVANGGHFGRFDVARNLTTRISAYQWRQLAILGYVDLIELTRPYSSFNMNWATPILDPKAYSVDSIIQRRAENSLVYRIIRTNGTMVDFEQTWELLRWKYHHDQKLLGLRSDDDYFSVLVPQLKYTYGVKG